MSHKSSTLAKSILAVALVLPSFSQAGPAAVATTAAKLGVSTAAVVAVGVAIGVATLVTVADNNNNPTTGTTGTVAP
jgi:hypothetical protein